MQGTGESRRILLNREPDQVLDMVVAVHESFGSDPGGGQNRGRPVLFWRHVHEANNMADKRSMDEMSG